MATIEFLPRKEFKLTLGSGEVITGKYGTWALKRFSLKRNYHSLPDLQAALDKMGLEDAVEYLLSAVEQSFREAKTQTSFPYSDIDACAWIDELGGIGGEQTGRLFQHASSEEKKSEPATA